MANEFVQGSQQSASLCRVLNRVPVCAGFSTECQFVQGSQQSASLCRVLNRVPVRCKAIIT